MPEITRRSFTASAAAAFGSLLALMPWRKPALPQRPWSARAAELFASEGMWCDFAAWNEWIVDALNRAHPDGECALPEDTIDRVWLYSVCCDLADGKGVANA